MEEFKVAVDAIDHLGCFGEVKLTEWIRGSKRPWMSTKDTNTLSYANHCGHSDVWWRQFLRKCHALGLLERRFTNLIKANGQYAVFTTYYLTHNGKLYDNSGVLVVESECAKQSTLSKPLSQKNAAMRILNSETLLHGGKENQAPDSHVFSGSKSSELKNDHYRAGKGSRIVDTVKYLLEDSSKWQPITTKQDYHFPEVLKDVTEQYLLYTPDVYQLSQATTSNPHFMWYDIQCSKGKKNVVQCGLTHMHDYM